MQFSLSILTQTLCCPQWPGFCPLALPFVFVSIPAFCQGSIYTFSFWSWNTPWMEDPHLYIWDLNLTMEPAVFTATGLHRFFAPNFWLMNGQLSNFGRWNNYHLKILTTMNYHTALYWKRNIMIYHWVWGLIPKSSGPKPISFAIFIVPAAQNPSKSIDHF